jgi:osmoprotectant transport system substrate-binding protein
MNRTSTVLAGAIAGLLLLSACGGSDPLAPGGDAPAPSDTIRITSADFPENRLLAEIYAQTLESRGVTVERDFGVGAREFYFRGLTEGSWDLVPDYTGVLLQYINKDATETAPDEVYDALKTQVPAPLQVLERSSAENKDAIVVTAETAQKYGRSLADYGSVCGQLVFGGPPEFETRPDGLPGIAKTYGCTFQAFRPLDTGGPVTVAALADGTVQAANLFTTDPTIEERGFVALDDPQNNFAAQNVVPLINSEKATPEVTEALNAVSAKLTTEGLIALNRQLNAPDKPDVETVAEGWIAASGL